MMLVTKLAGSITKQLLYYFFNSGNLSGKVVKIAFSKEKENGLKNEEINSLTPIQTFQCKTVVPTIHHLVKKERTVFLFR